MAATEPLYQLLDLPNIKMTKNDVLLAEIILFLQITGQLNNTITHEKTEEELQDNDKEIKMFEDKFVKTLIEDILSTEEYTLSGMAYYLKIPEEILTDILIGYNQSPSLCLARKIMELHRLVRRDHYNNVLHFLVKSCLQKVANE